MEEKLMVATRDGMLVPFDPTRIDNAVMRAALASGKSQGNKEGLHATVSSIVREIETRFADGDFLPNVENIHDVVEKHLMMDGHFEVAKAYILYRAERRREEQGKRKQMAFLKKLLVKKSDGSTVLFNPSKVRQSIARCCEGLDGIDQGLLFEESVKNVYSGVTTQEIDKAIVQAAVSMIETEPNYDIVASRAYHQRLRKEVFGRSTDWGTEEYRTAYKDAFVRSIRVGVAEGILDKRMASFDLEALAEKLVLERDEKFRFTGLDTLYERYFTSHAGRRLEMPQIFFMRVAMGLSLLERDKEKWVTTFYESMSEFRSIPSTPTLFHSGLTHPQLSSCYLTTVGDDLGNIFQSYQDNAFLSKWSGGLGNDWTPIRGTQAIIKSNGVTSQGVVPFLHIANGTTIAINRSGKRRGATCAYLECWHLDFEDFLHLRKETGDWRRRTHDMNTASWIPDLFMKRVREEGNWTFFSPDEVPDLHDLYGRAFEEAYERYEKLAAEGKIAQHRSLPAKELWKKMLASLFETGHPWPNFKDPANIRSPQDHDGVIHSSNLCTEILLNTKATKTVASRTAAGVQTITRELGEVAVCNLQSIVLHRHVVNGEVDLGLLADTVRIAMRMLDNVIDLNYYPIPEAEHSNMKHRPVGLGTMGLQDALYEMGMSFENADEFVDMLQEFISYHAIDASADLAAERGRYETFEGSKWDRGIFPLDTLALHEQERGVKIDVPRTTRMDWDALKAKVKRQGMRNSNTMAIAPTATISTIVGCLGPCIEPIYKNLFVESNMSGEFTVLNRYLVNDLKKLGMWNRDMLDRIKYHEGSIQAIEEIPAEIRERYKEVFEIDANRLIDLTALRGKWIDQSQSHNIFYKGSSAKRLSEIYFYAWEKGLKTTYYLRTLGKSQNEKSTLDAAKFGMTQKRNFEEEPAPKACRIDNPDCEACQ